MPKYKVALIGYGYWGKNLLRNLEGNSKCEVKYICDTNPSVHQLLRGKGYESEVLQNDYMVALRDPEINIVVICTPTETHYRIVKNALYEGKHVLVEKPFTSTSIEAHQLIELAKDKGKIVHVDHTFVYTDAVRFIHNHVSSNNLGFITYIDSVRVNLGLFRHQDNVLFDLLPHDISIMNVVLGYRPNKVNCSGVKTILSMPESIAYCTLFYPNNIIANVHLNWNSPVKIRKMIFRGNKQTLIYNDLEPVNKIELYNSEIKMTEENLADYILGDIHIPKIGNNEALKIMIEDFIDHIEDTSDMPLRSTDETGLEVVQIIEACQESMENEGKRVIVDYS